MSFVTNGLLLEQTIEYAYQNDVILIGSAGNDDWNCDVDPNFCYPAYHPEVIAVAGTNFTDGRWNYSGEGSNYGSLIDVSAPARLIWTTKVGDNYGYASGTSMSAPIVAGWLRLFRE